MYPYVVSNPDSIHSSTTWPWLLTRSPPAENLFAAAFSAHSPPPVISLPIHSYLIFLIWDRCFQHLYCHIVEIKVDIWRRVNPPPQTHTYSMTDFTELNVNSVQEFKLVPGGVPSHNTLGSIPNVTVWLQLRSLMLKKYEKILAEKWKKNKILNFQQKKN